MPHTIEEIERRFTYHSPKEGQPAWKYAALRAQVRHTAYLFIEHCPDSRELDIAIQKLEEAIMWANSAIARRA